MMKLLRLLLVIASALLLSLAYPPVDLGILVWVWMFPLLFALWSGPTAPTPVKKWKRRLEWLKPFSLGWICGFVFFVNNLSWIRHSSRVIYGAKGNEWMGWSVELMGWGAVVGLSGIIAVYWGLWAAFAATIGKPRLTGMLGASKKGQNDFAMFGLSLESLRCAFLNAAAWSACEWLRGTLFSGFGWNGLGVPLISELALVQSADIVGINGLSFLPVFCACILYNTVLRFQEEVRTSWVRPHLDFFVGVLLLLGDFAYGFRILSAPPPPQSETVPLRVLLVQLNVPQSDAFLVHSFAGGQNDERRRQKADEIRRGYESITQKFVVQGLQQTDLVIWPESALPHPLYDPSDNPFVQRVLSLGDFSLLTGVDIWLPDEPGYTGAVLLHGDLNSAQIYRKVHLVPFGEYLPGRSIPLVEKLLGDVLPGDFASGASTEPLKLARPAGVQIIPLVCFEDTVGGLARQFIRQAPQLLVNCTNDGWFLRSIQNEQHLMNARFRCIELRRPMARAANTGVTGFIGSDGRMNHEDRLEGAKTGSVFVKGAKPKELQLLKNPPMTFYAEHGDLFSMVMLGISLLAVPLTIIMRPRSPKPVTAPE